MKYPKVLANPLWWIALILFGFSIWSEFPVLTFKTFPHFPFVRGYGGMALLLLARSIAQVIH